MKTARSAFRASRILALLALLLPALAIAGWTSIAALPTGVADAQYATFSGKLYAAGGYATGGPVSALQIYDPAANTWTQGAAMPSTRYQGTMQAIGSRLYVVGGWYGPLPTSTLMIYDTASNAWSDGAYFPTLSGCGQSGVLSGRMYVLNACDGYSGYVHDFYSYDPGTDTWTVRASPSYDHAYGAAGVINGKLYVAGGFDDVLQTHTRLEIYDPASDTWSAGPALPGKRANAGAAVLNGILYLIGGQDGSARLTSSVAYDPAAGTWTTLPDLLPGGLQQLSAMASGSQLYAFGGYTTSQVGQAYALTPAAAGAGPSATLSTNQASFTQNSNEVLSLSATFRAGTAAGIATDLYVQADVAGFPFYLSLYWGPPAGWMWSATPAPVLSNIPLADYYLPNFYSTPIAGLPAATYAFTVFALRSGYAPYSATGTLATATATMTINPAVQPPAPNADPCTYYLTPTSQSFSATGGESWMTVRQRESTCLVVEWTPRSNVAWITGVYAYGMSNGQGNVAFTVLPNTTTVQRQGTISVAGQLFTVTQAGANQFQGSIVGNWGGLCQFDLIPVSESGSFSMNIDANGTVSGSYSGSDSGMIAGSVDTGGNFAAGGSASGGVSWQGQFVLVGGGLRGGGNWTLTSLCSGSWSSNP